MERAIHRQLAAPGAAAREPVQRVACEALAATAIVPIISPLATATALIGAVMSDPHRAGAPLHLRRALLAHLRQRDIAALFPLRSIADPSGAGGRPNPLAPTLRGASFRDELDAVRAVDPQAVAGEVAAARSAGIPVAAWRFAMAQPGPWLARYAAALHRAWAVLEPIWTRSADLLDREVERISVQLARGAGAPMLTQLYPYCRVDGGELLLPSHSPHDGRVHVGRTLWLHPLIAPMYCSGWSGDGGDGSVVAVRYAAPGSWRAFAGEQAPPASLTALIGPQRAKILRSLDREVTAGDLAEVLQGAPSMVSHHLRALESAGLITRSRAGRHVLVRRSGRGTELATMYDRG